MMIHAVRDMRVMRMERTLRDIEGRPVEDCWGKGGTSDDAFNVQWEAIRSASVRENA